MFPLIPIAAMTPTGFAMYKIVERLFQDARSMKYSMTCRCCTQPLQPKDHVRNTGDLHEFRRDEILCRECACPVDSMQYDGEILAPSGYCRVDRLLERKDWVQQEIERRKELAQQEAEQREF